MSCGLILLVDLEVSTIQLAASSLEFENIQVQASGTSEGSFPEVHAAHL